MKKIKKKKTLYQKSLIAFSCILLILSEAVIIYVAYSLRLYENNIVENYMDNLVDNIKKAVSYNNADKYFTDNKLESDYEKKSSLNKGYKELFDNSKITYKKDDDNIFDLYANDTLVATITLDDSNKVTKLGLLNFSILDIKEIKTYTEEGLYKVEAYISSDYTLYINNNKVSEDDLVLVENIEGFEELPSEINITKSKHYLITKLTYKPDIKIVDSSNKEVDYLYEDGIYNAVIKYQTDDYEEAIKYLDVEFNPMTIAEKWSLFMTNDLSGMMHGFSDLSTSLVENTTLYNRAYSWATGVDITFTSIHTLDNPIFSNETMSNFMIYDKNSFSVDIHIEKLIHITSTQTKNDILNERMYFVYYDGLYHLVSMKTITE